MQDVTQYVSNALEAGFSHIDTAASTSRLKFDADLYTVAEPDTVYDTEQYVATALRESGLSRADVYITTKFDGGDIPTEARKSIAKVCLCPLALNRVLTSRFSLA